MVHILKCNTNGREVLSLTSQKYFSMCKKREGGGKKAAAPVFCSAQHVSKISLYQEKIDFIQSFQLASNSFSHCEKPPIVSNTAAAVSYPVSFSLSQCLLLFLSTLYLYISNYLPVIPIWRKEWSNSNKGWSTYKYRDFPINYLESLGREKRSPIGY